jgi:tetrahydromethanopterin S-methyltransferase subunit G
MRRILSIGGKCDKCSEHVELRVTSTIGRYTHIIYGVVGFTLGGLIAWLI